MQDQQSSLNGQSQNSQSASASADTAGPLANALNPSASGLKPSTEQESPADTNATSALHVPTTSAKSLFSSQSPPQSSHNQQQSQNAVPYQQTLEIPSSITPPRELAASPQVEPLHQRLGERPTTNRRLTIDAGFARPSLLTQKLHHKSSSAVPTLSSTQAVGGSTTPSNSSPLAPGTRRASSASTRNGKLNSMATRDFSATDLLKQAMMHRYVQTYWFCYFSFAFFFFKRARFQDQLFSTMFDPSLCKSFYYFGSLELLKIMSQTVGCPISLRCEAVQILHQRVNLQSSQPRA
jgi:hypothetical protein